MIEQEPLATPRQVSDHTRVSERTLEYWRAHGKGPRYVRMGRHVRYDWADVKSWLEQQASAPADGAA
jgi:excisionase family DNA binding protein